MENDVNPGKKINAKFYTSLLLVVVFLVAGFVLLRGTTPPPQETKINNTFGDIGIMPITEKDHILGDPNAKVIIVEYSDTECPFCKRFHRDMQTLTLLGCIAISLLPPFTPKLIKKPWHLSAQRPKVAMTRSGATLTKSTPGLILMTLWVNKNSML
jgi:hypothetical protein